MKKSKKGFSMVELLFVMAVIATLAAIAIPVMENSEKAAALTSMNEDIHNAKTAYEAAKILNYED